MFSGLKKAAYFSASFLFLQFGLLCILLFAFFWRAPTPESNIAWLYFLSLPNYYYLLITLIIVPLSPLAFFAKTRPLLIIPMLGLQYYVVADIFVFDIYRFHINQMLIDMFLFDLKGIGIPTSILAVAGLAALALLAVNVYLLKLAQRIHHQAVLIAMPALFSLFCLNQMIHVWGNAFNQRSITQYTLQMPLYLPITSSSTAQAIEKYLPSWVPEQNEEDALWANAQLSTKGALKYPLTQLTCQPEHKQQNILIFLLESWRSGMVTPEISPNIHAFAQQSYQFTNHLSGGNVTITGLFTLLYGLHPSYLDQVKAAPLNYQTVLNQTLQQHNYRTQVYTPSDLSRFSMRQMFFGGIASNDYHYINQHPKVEDNDAAALNKLVDDISRDTIDTPPWYRFAFLNSSHYPYDYPEQHKIYTPVGKPGGFVLNKSIDSEPYLNDYKNSLHYMDALFGKMLAALKSSGQLGNTTIVITGDHGEEFNDNKLGYWGHGSNFTRVQTSAPLIVRVPGQQQGEVVNKRSSHIDIVPTLLRHSLACEGDFNGISNGEDLFNLPDHRPLMSGSYVNKAYIVNDAVFVEEAGIKSYDLDDLSDKDQPVQYDQIRVLMDQAQHFLER